ncbi:MAG: hypothetical protein K6G63_09080 [Eubacterium sp.]|nr:hypothetical protein [Eubacterium sp.]
MKKIITIPITILALLITACGGPSAQSRINVPQADKPATAETKSYEEDALADVKTPEDRKVDELEEAREKTEQENSGVDEDLTKLSATMVYSTVFDMMNNPKAHEGKSVRVDGTFTSSVDEKSGKRYFACIIKDATECCAQGMEIELAGDKKFPEDYPKEGAEMRVRGVYETYTEGEAMYCVLRNAVIEG